MTVRQPPPNRNISSQRTEKVKCTRTRKLGDSLSLALQVYKSKKEVRERKTLQWTGVVPMLGSLFSDIGAFVTHTSAHNLIN